MSGAVIERIRALDPEARRKEIVDVLVDHFQDLFVADPDAFRHKFRKMAGSPFAFYRGSAVLFYLDMEREPGHPLGTPASRVWIQGDLHAENFGTYMSSEGRLVFDVNDFDEAYIGHFAWDLRRLAASLALLGYAKAFADDEIREIVTTAAHAYAKRLSIFAAGADPSDFSLTLETTAGPVHAALERASTESRNALLDRMTTVEGCTRKLRRGDRLWDIDGETRAKVETAFAEYLKTRVRPAGLEQPQLKDIVASGGFGIGSAGLPAFTMLIAGPTDALESDILLSMKQGNVCAVGRIVEDEGANGYFQHHGHRTVVSQQALQASTDAWLGYTQLDGVGQVVQEISPYEVDLDWSDLDDTAACRELAGQLGEATAKIHSVADDDDDVSLVPFATEEAITADIGDDHASFANELAGFALAYADVVRDDHRLFVDTFRNHGIAGL